MFTHSFRSRSISFSLGTRMSLFHVTTINDDFKVLREAASLSLSQTSVRSRQVLRYANELLHIPDSVFNERSHYSEPVTHAGCLKHFFLFS